MIEWTVGLRTGTEPQSGCTFDGKLTGNVLRCSSGSFLKKKPPCIGGFLTTTTGNVLVPFFVVKMLLSRCQDDEWEQCEDDDGNERKHICFPFRRRFTISSAALPAF
jgi:hypothetical protein